MIVTTTNYIETSLGQQAPGRQRDADIPGGLALSVELEGRDDDGVEQAATAHQADALLEVADKVTEVVATATVRARRLSRRTLICGAVAAVCGIAVIMIIKKRRRAAVDQEIEEILT